MALVSLNCPNCGGSLKMEDTMEKGFCMYCGTSFLVKDEIQRVQVEHSGNVNLSINRETEINNLLTRAEQKIAEFRAKSSNVTVEQINKDYIEKVLDLEPHNQRAISVKQKLTEAADYKKNEYQKEQIASNKLGCIIILISILASLLLLGFIYLT